MSFYGASGFFRINDKEVGGVSTLMCRIRPEDQSHSHALSRLGCISHVRIRPERILPRSYHGGWHLDFLVNAESMSLYL